MTHDPAHEGGCPCGAIRYRIASPVAMAGGGAAPMLKSSLPSGITTHDL